MGFEQALDFSARMRRFPERPLTRLRIGLGRAMEKSRAYARLQQAFNGRVVVRRRGVVVAPVGQRGGAAVELVERTHQRGNVQVLRLEHGGQAGVHVLEVLEQRPVGGQAAQCGLPGVHVGVDQAWNDDAPGAIHALRIVRMNDRRDLGDDIAGHQNIAPAQVALGVHRDDGRAADQNPGRHASGLQSVAHLDVFRFEHQAGVSRGFLQQHGKVNVVVAVADHAGD